MTILAAPLQQGPTLKAWLAYAVAGLALTAAAAGLGTKPPSGAWSEASLEASHRNIVQL